MTSYYYYRMQQGSQGNPIDNLIKKEAGIEVFYDTEDFLSYLQESNKQQNSFIEYIKKKDYIILLIDYCLFPEKIRKVKQNIAYDDLCRYAYQSLVVFEILKQRLVEDNPSKYLGYIFSYLDQKVLDATSSSYFEQIMIHIFSQENVVSWILQKSNQHQMAKFVTHVGTQVMCDQLLIAIKWNKHDPQKFTLLNMLVERLDKETEEDSEVLQNISHIFCSIFSAIFEDGKYQLQQYADFLMQPQYLKILFQKIYTINDSYNIFYLVSILIEIASNKVAIQKLGPLFAQEIENMLVLITGRSKSNSQNNSNSVVIKQQNLNYEIPTSYDVKINHFGQGRMKCLEFFAVFMEYYHKDQALLTKISQTSFFKDLLQLFSTYTWNTKLSFVVENVFVRAIQLNNEQVNENLLNKAKIVDFIVENYRKQTIFARYGNKQRQFKRGHVGSLTKIARALEETVDNQTIQKYLNKSEKWETFKKNKLNDLTKREELEWEFEIEELGNLPSLEHNWISYMDGSLQKGGLQKKESSMTMIDSKKNQLEHSYNYSNNNNLDINLSDLKLVKVKSTEFVMNDPNNTKELFIYIALYGCGYHNCTMKFCRSNPQFAKAYPSLSQYDVTSLTTSENLTNFKPCESIARQLSNKRGKSKLEFDPKHLTFGSLITISAKNKFSQRSWLKSSMVNPNSKQNIKDVVATTVQCSKATIWVLEIIENEWVQIRSKQFGFLLRSGNSISNDQKHLDVALGDYQVAKEVAIEGRHISRPGLDLESKWIITCVGEHKYTIVNVNTKGFLMLSDILSNNGQDADVSLTTLQNENIVWDIQYL